MFHRGVESWFDGAIRAREKNRAVCARQEGSGGVLGCVGCVGRG